MQYKSGGNPKIGERVVGISPTFKHPISGVVVGIRNLPSAQICVAFLRIPFGSIQPNGIELDACEEWVWAEWVECEEFSLLDFVI